MAFLKFGKVPKSNYDQYQISTKQLRFWVNAEGNNVFKGNFSIPCDKVMPAGGFGIYASDGPCPKNCPDASTDFA